MPNLNNPDMEQSVLKGTKFQFSTTRLDNLGSTEYTLITIAVDASGSVESYRNDLEKCLKEIVNSCKHSPRADNLMIRLISFNSRVSEEHGFKLLSTCNPDDYLGLLNPSGSTALYDSSYSSLGVLLAEGKRLTDNDFNVNAIFFCITDGADNASSFTPKQVHDEMSKAVKDESLESLVSVLVGVGTDTSTDIELQRFRKDAGFTQYVSIGDANSKNLAKLAAFVSKSVSAQSQSLGSGSASNQASLTF
jgi:uncharacterized protein YegL